MFVLIPTTIHFLHTQCRQQKTKSQNRKQARACTKYRRRPSRFARRRWSSQLLCSNCNSFVAAHVAVNEWARDCLSLRIDWRVRTETRRNITAGAGAGACIGIATVVVDNNVVCRSNFIGFFDRWNKCLPTKNIYISIITTNKSNLNNKLDGDDELVNNGGKDSELDTCLASSLSKNNSSARPIEPLITSSSSSSSSPSSSAAKGLDGTYLLASVIVLAT